MSKTVINCIINWDSPTYCQLSQTCKGWGCRFLTTPIEEIPVTVPGKSQAVLQRCIGKRNGKECWNAPHYRSMFIDEVLENIGIN